MLPVHVGLESLDVKEVVPQSSLGLLDFIVQRNDAVGLLELFESESNCDVDESGCGQSLGLVQDVVLEVQPC